MKTLAKTVKQLGKLWNHMKLRRLVFKPEVQASVASFKSGFQTLCKYDLYDFVSLHHAVK